MSAADRAEWEAWVQARLAEFHRFAGHGFVWERMPATAGRDDADAYRGAWHTVKPYVTEEFRLWVEQYGGRRLTYSEWLADAVHRRRQESERVRDYLDSAAYCTDRLEQWRELNAERDALIVAARHRGARFAELMAATGLSRKAVHNVLTAARARAHAEALAEAAAAAEAGAVPEAEAGPEAGQAAASAPTEAPAMPEAVGVSAAPVTGRQAVAGGVPEAVPEALGAGGRVAGGPEWPGVAEGARVPAGVGAGYSAEYVETAPGVWEEVF